MKATLPIQRVGADEPSARYGTTTTGNGYSRNGVGVARDVYTAGVAVRNRDEAESS